MVPPNPDASGRGFNCQDTRTEGTRLREAERLSEAQLAVLLSGMQPGGSEAEAASDTWWLEGDSDAGFLPGGLGGTRLCKSLSREKRGAPLQAAQLL